jgi:hypothetical protein
MKPKPEMIEGNQALKNFENGMKKVFRVRKKTEKKRESNRRKKSTL